MGYRARVLPRLNFFRPALFGSVTLATLITLLAVAPFARGDVKRKTVNLPRPDAGATSSEIAGIPDAGFRYTRTPADPDPPLKSAKQWIFDLRYQQGDVFLVNTRTLDLGVPSETPRVMGRFALELFDHAVLVERVRFDFPFLGAPAARSGGPIALDQHVTSTIGVVFPQTPRGTRLELVDRSTDERWQLPWPAKEQISSGDAGAQP